MDSQKKLTNEHGLFFGRYRARVEDNKHPKRWHMARVRLLGYWDDLTIEQLPWAEYMLSLGARKDEGEMMPSQPGDLVWVSFEAGDTRKPIIEGAVYSVDGKGTGKSLLPQDAWEKEYSHKRTGKQPAPPAHEYGDKVFDQMKFLQQLTMSGEYCITHKPSGTALHVNNSGQLVLHVESDRFDSTNGNKIEEITKNLEVIIQGASNVQVSKDSTIQVGDTLKTTAKKITEDADLIAMNGGKGVVTGACICPIIGKPHPDCSSTVTAGK